MHDFHTHSCTFLSLLASRGLFCLVIRWGRKEEKRPLPTVVTVLLIGASLLALAKSALYITVSHGLDGKISIRRSIRAG